jgi:hypothetical protein
MKRVAFIIALLCVLSPLAAHEGYYYTLSLSIFPYLSIPHYADDIPMRTAGGGEASIGALGFRKSHYDFSLELRYRGTTASIPHGFYRARGFDSLGSDLRFAYQLKEQIALFATVGTEINFYRGVDSAFASFSTALGAEFLLVQKPAHRLSLTVPITLHLRKEITAIQTAVGLRYQYFPTKGGQG